MPQAQQYIQSELPLSYNHRSDEHSYIPVHKSTVEQLVTSMFGEATPETAVALSIWNTLPIQYYSVVTEIAQVNQDAVFYSLLNMTNSVREHREIETALVSEGAQTSHYSLESLSVSRRLARNVAQGTRFYGIFEEVPLCEHDVRDIEQLSELQLYFLETLAAQVVGEEQLGYSRQMTRFTDIFYSLYVADVKSNDRRMAKLGAPQLRPFLLQLNRKWWSGKHRESLAQHIPEDIEYLDTETITPIVTTLFDERSFFSSREIAGLHEGDVTSWRFAARMGDIVEAVFVSRLQGKTNAEHPDISPFLRNLDPFKGYFKEWSSLTERSMMHFQKGGFFFEVVSHASDLMAQLLIERYSDMFAAQFPTDGRAIQLYQLQQALPTLKGSRLYSFAEEMGAWHLYSEIAHTPYIQSYTATHETISGWLLAYHFDQMVRLAMFFEVLRRLYTEALPYIGGKPGQVVLSQVHLDGSAGDDEFDERGARIDFIVAREKDIVDKEQTTSLSKLFDSGTPVEIEIYEVKSQISKSHFHVTARQHIEKEHREQLQFYITSIQKKYPNVTITKASVIYIDPLRTQELSIV